MVSSKLLGSVVDDVVCEELDDSSFSFEMCPEKLYDLNNMKLPFGCHAWELNLNFWRNKIEGL